ncbi:MAG: imidazole glycerol phosphate synthase subunit HisH [Candidatus Omnitrophica bacterium]|nr:imidazole glycerol phosphate synthase subunit HisH [Candidatus Omnitrophota bacterium]
MIAIIDYGMGNLRSVQKAFEKVGAQAIITHSPADIIKADRVVLPGVGAMAPAVQKINELGLMDVIRKIIREGKPFLGICLGLQLLFERSCEGGYAEGLRIFKGTVERFPQGKIPHMGWNQIKALPAGEKLCAGIADGENVYFCHSYFVKPTDSSIAATMTNYGIDYVSSVVSGNVWGVQFHPEKSQAVGLKILENFTKP